MYQDIIYEVADPVAIVTLNRPEKLNSFTYDTLREIREALENAAAEPSVVGIIITGNGRAFSAGLDASVLQAATSNADNVKDGELREPDETPGLFSWLLNIDKPVIAAVNGVAAGGGFVLAVMSDVRFAATEAMFTTVFSKRGLISEHGTSWIVPRLVGPGRALDMLWTSRKIGAEEALRSGLVEYICEPDELLPQARAYIEELAANVSPASMRDIKRLVYNHLGMGYDPALREANRLTMESLSRPDATEGAVSFIERRPARFPRLG